MIIILDISILVIVAVVNVLMTVYLWLDLGLPLTTCSLHIIHSTLRY